MDVSTQPKAAPLLSVALTLDPLSESDLQDLCDATDAAIKAGGGFGWLDLPAREVLERFWQGVIVMPLRQLFVARLDGVICGCCQLIRPPQNNEAQRHAAQITGLFVTPWARGHGLSRMLLEAAEAQAAKLGHSVINLDVRESMAHAIALYEGSGYVQFGTHPYYAVVDGQFVAGRYYTKKLDAS
ncbi:MAG: GNAT family N-acetyltransferase [Rhodospirillales bacterium]|nr:GNAT family N-acetyltransferase [Alphaproteobacteria bacterium]MCB9986597.1 GNAT family N-acetyltransferase [Rhodospirillales bacterium]USO06873.1 MAG: GNAT family N-acetyltransferase [Rhodospirillales bacterium]